MRYMKLLFCMLMLWPWSSVCAQFEGEIDLKVTTDEGGQSRETNISMFVKNEMISARVNGGGEGMRAGRFIVRGDKKLLWFIDDQRKMVLERSLEENQDRDSMARDESRQKPNVRKTGKTDTILGYSCEEWIDVGDDGETSVWCTSKLGDVYNGFSKSIGEMGKMRMRRDAPDWRKDFIDKNLFPLKAVSRKNGEVKSTQEVTKVERTKVADTLFEFPEDYQKQSMNFDMNKSMDRLKEMMRQHMQEKEKKDDKKDQENNKE